MAHIFLMAHIFFFELLSSEVCGIMYIYCTILQNIEHMVFIFKILYLAHESYILTYEILVLQF